MTNALLAQFIPEARELLERAGSGMLALEKTRSPEALDEIFRAVHTLKGTSGLFDIAPLTHLVHAAEDLLVEMRAGQLALAPAIADGLLESLDLVGHWIDVLETRAVLPADAETAMSDRVATLRGWLGATAPGGGGPPPAPSRGASPDQPIGPADAHAQAARDQRISPRLSRNAKRARWSATTFSSRVRFTGSALSMRITSASGSASKVHTRSSPNGTVPCSGVASTLNLWLQCRQSCCR